MVKRRRDESPERQVQREMVSKYPKENPVKNRADVNAFLRETMSAIQEGSLDREMDKEELGCFKYDFKNKDTDNSRNDETVITSLSLTFASGAALSGNTWE